MCVCVREREKEKGLENDGVIEIDRNRGRERVSEYAERVTDSVDLWVVIIHRLVQRLGQLPISARHHLKSLHPCTGSEVCEPALGGSWVTTEKGGGGEGGVDLLGYPVVGQYHALGYCVMYIKMLGERVSG